VTRHAPEPGTPNGDQRRAVERARELTEAAATVQTLATYLGVSTKHPGQFFYAAYTAAVDRLRDLLASLDEAGAGQADPGWDPLHAYIPAGPVGAAPNRPSLNPNTRSPAENDVTALPTASTTPANSVPRTVAFGFTSPEKNRTMKGLPARKPQSVRFTVVACTLTRTSPSFTAGVSTSETRTTSGGP
jgi:hypothetical protein